MWKKEDQEHLKIIPQISLGVYSYLMYQDSAQADGKAVKELRVFDPDFHKNFVQIPWLRPSKYEQVSIKEHFCHELVPQTHEIQNADKTTYFLMKEKEWLFWRLILPHLTLLVNILKRGFAAALQNCC